jgi:hypothetical protein
VDAPDTVATPVDADTHALLAAAVPVPVNDVVPFEHKVNVPEIVGAAVTVTVAVFEHPVLAV